MAPVGRLAVAAPFVDFSVTPEDSKQRELLHIKRWATGLLLLVSVVFIATSLLKARHPLFAYVAATCEAAMIGALADWFAVTALFRSPLNLPLPHSAIIPRNKARIAGGLGYFVQEHFLSTPALQVKVREVDPAARFAVWLRTPANSALTASYATRFAIYALDALDDRRVRGLLRRATAAKLQKLDVAYLAGSILETLTERRRHHALFEYGLTTLHKLLSRAETRSYLAGAISSQWPLARWVAESLRLDDIAAANVLNFVVAKLDQIRNEPEHEMRGQFDDFVRKFAGRLKTDPAIRATIRRLCEEGLLERAVANYVDGLWTDLAVWLDNDCKQRESKVGRELANLIERVGRRLETDPEIRNWVNEQILRAVPALVEEHGEAVARFIERQVNTWDDEKLIHELERNIGVDLQYIRINGTLVGGAIGLLIFSLMRIVGNG